MRHSRKRFEVGHVVHQSAQGDNGDPSVGEMQESLPDLGADVQKSDGQPAKRRSARMITPATRQVFFPQIAVCGSQFALSKIRACECNSHHKLGEKQLISDISSERVQKESPLLSNAGTCLEGPDLISAVTLRSDVRDAACRHASSCVCESFVLMNATFTSAMVVACRLSPCRLSEMLFAWRRVSSDKRTDAS